jgi:hypothetical protein
MAVAGALLPLAFQGAHTAQLGVPYSTNDITIQDSINGVLNLRKSGDKATPLALIITQEGTDPFQQTEAIFGMEIGGQLMFKVPLSLLRSLATKYKISGNKHCVYFDWDAFFPPIPLIRLSYHEVTFSIRGFAINQGFSLMIRYDLLDLAERREFALRQKYDTHIQNISCSRWVSQEPSTTFDLKLQAQGLVKGFFIETDSDCEITNMTLWANELTVKNYDEFALEIIAKRLGPKCVYIPFDPAAVMLSREPASFATGAIYFGRIDTARIKLEFSTPQSALRIMGLQYNYLRTQSGMGGLKFENDTSILLTALRHVPNPTPIPRAIPVGRETCPISYNNFLAGDLFYQCETCHYCYGKEVIDTHLGMRDRDRYKCPMCRTTWADWTIYRVVVAATAEEPLE